MFKIHQELPTQIKEFLNLVVSKTEGYDVYLGGGYLRDLYFNHLHNVEAGLYYPPSSVQPKQPKDLDLFFIPQKGYSPEGKELPTIPRSYINYDMMASEVPNVRENVEKVRGIFVPDLPTPDVQFIVYDKHLTMVQLAVDMDCNINQVMYHPETELSHNTSAFYDGHENKVIEMLHEFENERKVARILRMAKKFPDYDIRHNMVQVDYDMTVHNLTHKPKKFRRSTGLGASFFDDDNIGM
ncbi:hypothetical protein KUA24_152 [Vibrio phage HNL01]|nr:hypothetical protein KUA24_152 [Vibrio phage HNL01]